MFDVAGLPGNEEGLPVFKMSYNSRTEFNVCYAVRGNAMVRMALHPYSEKHQAWGPWLTLDGECTYHLNETASDSAADPTGHRNKHEVNIRNGYVSLFCLFDPAPTGMERHRPGEYSDYEPIPHDLKSAVYEQYMAQMRTCDDMVDTLSIAKARNRLGHSSQAGTLKIYQNGKDAQRRLETALHGSLSAAGFGRDDILRTWMNVA
jgi:hypothetical protein